MKNENINKYEQTAHSQVMQSSVTKYLANIDCSVQQLSSVKLINILRLSRISGCEMGSEFIKEVEAELIRRADDTEWNLPH